MPNIEVNGTRLEYTEQGTGQPIVFVHGVLNDLRAWKDQMEVFGSQYRAVALSCRYYYPNAAISDDAALSLDTLVDDLAAFLRALHLAPAHLVGASNGAFACMLLALREPKLVRTLVLAEPPVLPILGVSVPPKPQQILKLLVRSPQSGDGGHKVWCQRGWAGPPGFQAWGRRAGPTDFCHGRLGPQGGYEHDGVHAPTNAR